MNSYLVLVSYDSYDRWSCCWVADTWQERVYADSPEQALQQARETFDTIGLPYYGELEVVSA